MNPPDLQAKPVRDPSLDLLKWLAMLTMVLDHLRYVGWSVNFLYVPGRFAFPWFCLAIAANLARSGAARHVPWRYLGWLVVFSVLAEVPYRMFVLDADTLNVLPTLALGLLVAQGWRDRTPLSLALAGAALVLGWVFWSYLMFGFFGVLLPLACLLVLRRSPYATVLPGIVCIFSNAWPQMFGGVEWGDPISIFAVGVCLIAPLIGMALLRSALSFKVWPMRRWAYAIYPLHFLLLLGVRQIVAL
jgi:hypothetical protein